MSENTTQRPLKDDQPNEQPEATPAADETPNAPQEDAQAPDAGDEPEGGEVGRLRREAAGHRKRLREVEAERDAVTAQRDALAASVLSDALKGTGVNAQLFAAAGRSITEFIGDDGLDRAAITRAARDVRREYGISNPAVSRYTGTGAERPESTPTWADAVKKG